MCHRQMRIYTCTMFMCVVAQINCLLQMSLNAHPCILIFPWKYILLLTSNVQIIKCNAYKYRQDQRAER